MRFLSVLVSVLLTASTACLRNTEYRCSDDSACGNAGRCESTGFCSFADPDCTTGRRYDASAGDLANQCTGGMSIDGGVDSATDGMPDGQNVGCPGTYMPLAGVPGHVYLVVTNADNWQTQQAGCKLTSASAYLAVPDDATELMALDALAGAGRYWVGINDRDTEMTWRNVLDMPQTYLPWKAPAPDNAAGGQGEDCVEALSAEHMINDLRCNTGLPAICECNP